MPTNNVQALLAQDLPDPTDFSAPEMRQLDTSLRCAVCSEFFDAPISLTCGHCFCSMCIRQHILREPECPTCRKSTNEAQFRQNTALEEVIYAWKAARPDVLRLEREERTRAESGRNAESNTTPRRFQTPARNRRKRRHIEVSESSDSDIVCVAGPSNPKNSSETRESSPLQAKSARKASRRTNLEPSSDPREEDLLQPDSLVNCPICGNLVEYQVINVHIDGPDCGKEPLPKADNPSNPNVKTEWSKVFDGMPKKGKNKDNSDLDEIMERLPKVSYNVIKDKALKKLLAEQRLPLSGDQNARIARHRRWVMMVNSNLDKTKDRKTAPELRLELKAWEEAQKGQHKSMVKDHAAHEIIYKGEFDRLVEELRQRRSNCPASGDVVEEDGHEERL